jgi:hypothetical protein
MGITTNVIIENRLSQDELLNLSDQLISDKHLAEALSEFDGLYQRECPNLQANASAKRWHLTWAKSIQGMNPADNRLEYNPSLLAEFIGPFTTVYVHQNLANISLYMCRWHIFLSEPEFRKPLYEATRRIAMHLNTGHATTALFFPDSSFAETAIEDELHCNMPDLLAWMQNKFGPPQNAWEVIVNNDDKGYYMTHWHGNRQGDIHAL